MKKESSPEVSGDVESRPKRRRGRGFLAPAALATLLAGGGGAAASERDDESSGGEEVERAATPWQEWQLRRVAEHPNPDYATRLAAGLPAILAAMGEMERVGLIASWAVSPSPRVRLAIARALRHAPPSIGSLSAIEHLARDPSPLVRVAIAEAAWLRRREDPTRLIAVLHRLADDNEQFVREVAHLALGDV